METSTLITIIYFCVNILLLLILTIHIIRTGEHYEAKSLGKDIWAQRKIYLPLIVHFYDAATDLGVVYYWHGLYIDERDGVYDYESVDMEIFFWCGLAFLLFYRIILFLVIIYTYFDDDDDEIGWYDPLLVVLHLYVFKTVFLSYKEAQETIKKNIEARKQNSPNVRAKSAPQVTSSPTAPSEPDLEAGSTATVTAEVPGEAKEEEIEVAGIQFSVLLIESVTESLPQIMLQSVFIIRSYNDPELQDTEIWLLLLSVLASLLSISDKFIKFDGMISFDDEPGVSPKFQSIRNGLCCNSETMWYATRSLWRICHIGSGFSIYVLIWTVLGGAFLPIWCGVVYMLFSIAQYMEEGKSWGVLLIPIAQMAGVMEFKWHSMLIKWVTNLIGLVVIAIFAMTQFECAICAEAAQRNFDNEIENGVRNHRIAIFYAFGCGSFFMDILLLFVMHCGLEIVE